MTEIIRPELTRDTCKMISQNEIDYMTFARQTCDLRKDNEDLEKMRLLFLSKDDSIFTPDPRLEECDKQLEEMYKSQFPYEVYEDLYEDAGKENGYGIYKWPDGSVYEGTFINGNMSGKGVYTCNGVIHEGEFRNGLLHGKFIVCFPDGHISSTYFINGIEVKDEDLDCDEDCDDDEVSVWETICDEDEDCEESDWETIGDEESDWETIGDEDE